MAALPCHLEKGFVSRRWRFLSKDALPPSDLGVILHLNQRHVPGHQASGMFQRRNKRKKKSGLYSRPLTPNGEETLYISVGSPKERKREGTSYPLKYPKHCWGNIEPLQMLSALSPKKPKNMWGGRSSSRPFPWGSSGFSTWFLEQATHLLRDITS